MESSSSFLFLLRVAGEKILSTPSHPRHGWLAPQWDLATAKPPCLPACTTLVLGWWIWRSRGGFEGHMGRSRNYGRRYGEIKQPPGKPRGRRLQNRGWRSRGGERSNCGRLTTPPPRPITFCLPHPLWRFFFLSLPNPAQAIQSGPLILLKCRALLQPPSFVRVLQSSATAAEERLQQQQSRQGGGYPPARSIVLFAAKSLLLLPTHDRGCLRQTRPLVRLAL